MIKKILTLIIILTLIPIVIAETTSGNYPSQLVKNYGIYDLEYLFGKTNILNTGEIEIGLCQPRIIDYLKNVANIVYAKKIWQGQNPKCQNLGKISGDIIITQKYPKTNLMGVVKIKRYGSDLPNARYSNKYATLNADKITINKYKNKQNIFKAGDFFIVKPEGKITYKKNGAIVTCYNCGFEIHSSKPNLFSLTGEAIAIPETEYYKIKKDIDQAMDIYKSDWKKHVKLPNDFYFEIKDFNYVNIGTEKKYIFTSESGQENKGKAVINLKGYGFSINSRLANTKIRGVVEFMLTQHKIVSQSPLYILKGNNVRIEKLRDTILVDIKKLKYKESKQNVFKSYDVLGFLVNDIKKCYNNAYNCIILKPNEMKFISGGLPVYKPLSNIGPTIQPKILIIFYKNNMVNKLSNSKLSGDRDLIVIRDPSIKSPIANIVIRKNGLTFPTIVHWSNFGTSFSSKTDKGLFECEIDETKCYLNGKNLII